jgi:hypothetical protein
MRTRVALTALLLGTRLLGADPAAQDNGAGFDPDQKPLRLASGLVYPKWQIIGETASTVTIRYPGGAAKVDKKLLPENLQAVYKIDPAAVAAEAKADAEQKAIYDSQVRATQEKQKEEHDALVASAAAAKAQQVSPAQRAAVSAADSEKRARAEQIAAIKKEAKRYANHYFRYEYLGGVSGAVVERLDVDLREPRDVNGWPGRYAVDGTASLEYFASAGISFQKSAANAFTVTLDWKDGQASVVDFTNHVAP